MKIKNVRAGILIISDAELKLAPGETVPVEKLTREMQKAVDGGLLACIEAEQEAKPKPKTTSRTETKVEQKKPEKPSAKPEQTPKSGDPDKGKQPDEGTQGQLIGTGDGSN